MKTIISTTASVTERAKLDKALIQEATVGAILGTHPCITATYIIIPGDFSEDDENDRTTKATLILSDFVGGGDLISLMSARTSTGQDVHKFAGPLHDLTSASDDPGSAQSDSNKPKPNPIDDTMKVMLSLTFQACCALVHTHKCGIQHQDIQPEK